MNTDEEKEVEKAIEDMEKMTPMMNQREKFWAELNTEEKIERMREQIKLLIHKVDNVNDVVSMLQQHTHQEGVMVIPMNAPIGGGMGMIARGPRQGYSHKGDDVYF